MVKLHNYFHFSNFHQISLKVSEFNVFFNDCFISPIGNQFHYTAIFLCNSFFQKVNEKLFVNIFKTKTYWGKACFTFLGVCIFWVNFYKITKVTTNLFCKCFIFKYCRTIVSNIKWSLDNRPCI